jgi:class 3 adenylate cyclase/CHASE2 domain-containing sensor protein
MQSSIYIFSIFTQAKKILKNKKSDKSRNKTRIHLVIGAASCLVIILCSFLSIFEKVELKTVDWRFKIRGKIYFDPSIATIDIDDRSLEKERWQDWKRDKHSNVIDKVADLGADMIALDMYFPEPSQVAAIVTQIDTLTSFTKDNVLDLFFDYDNNLAESIKSAGIVFLSQNFLLPNDQDSDYIKSALQKLPPQKMQTLETLKSYSIDYPDGWESNLDKYIDIEAPIDVLLHAAKGVGFTHAYIDADERIRRYPLIIFMDGRVYPSLALIMASGKLDVPLSSLEIVPGHHVKLPNAKISENDRKDIIIPIDDKGLMNVNWASKWEDKDFLHISSSFLLSGNNATMLKESNILSIAKRLILENPSLVQNSAQLVNEIKAFEPDDSDVIERIVLLLQLAVEFSPYATNNESTIQDYFAEKNIQYDGIPEQQLNFINDLFISLRNNQVIALELTEKPAKTLENICEDNNFMLTENMKTNFIVMSDIISKHGQIRPEDHPMYFLPVIQDNNVIDVSDFEGKTLFYGITASNIQRPIAMPFSASYPIVGLHANAFNTIITNNFITNIPKIFNILFIVVFGLLTSLIISIIDDRYSLIIVLSLVISYIILALYLFKSGMIIEMFSPIAAPLSIYTLSFIYNYFSELKEKLFIKNTFGQYLDPSVVEQMIDNPEIVKLGGEQRELSIFFSDIAGFTNISESMYPEDLVMLLNEYFEKMTNIIMENRGTVDKFEGDAIMAFYGAPVFLENHAELACFACLDMQIAMERLREKFRKENKAEFYARMGLNTGTVLVGNIGSFSRKDYSVIGDAVNLASRLESLNKHYETTILIGQNTYEQAKNAIETREVDIVKVVGKQESVRIYELLGRKGELSDKHADFRDTFESGLHLFRTRQWKDAKSLFEKALALNNNDLPTEFYLKNCTEYLINPPQEDEELTTVFSKK